MNAAVEVLEEEYESWDYLAPESNTVDTDLIDGLTSGFLHAYPRPPSPPDYFENAVLMGSEWNLTTGSALESDGTSLPYEDSAILTEAPELTRFKGLGNSLDIAALQCVEASEIEATFARGMSITAIANEIHRDSRRMEPWEMKVAAKAFWDEFE
jgi:hypothetical protein